jgi:sugar/nucleoside kinase (ribokinase family)
MVIVLGDILADYAIRVENLHIKPKDLQRVSYLALGPGGACNVAIMAAHLGLPVVALGEVGRDLFGEIVLEGLAAEGVDISHVIVSEGAQTPVANVLVDEQGEPAYLGFPGSLHIMDFPQAWRGIVDSSEALYADGWIDQQGEANIILDGLRAAKETDVPSFFDPGPGNPKMDNAWHGEAASLSTVLLATEEEARRLSGEADPVNSARVLLARGCRLVVIKRGMAGCFLLTDSDLHIAPGLPVVARDATGAGDSLAAAVIFGYLNGYDLQALGDLANATGAAKVLKLGTGHNMPTVAEVNQMLARFGSEVKLEVNPTGQATQP